MNETSMSPAARRDEPRETPVTIHYRLLSLLLEYPDESLMSVLWQIRMLVDNDPEGWQAREREAIAGLLDRLESQPLTESQADYVRTFDLAPEHSLHLTHHLFGDDKNRGPALIDLSEYYREHGLTLDANELPDYLPLVLEFASTLGEDEALDFLGDMHRLLRVLAANLDRAGSPYAGVVRAVESRAALRAPAEAAPRSPLDGQGRRVIPIRRDDELSAASEPPDYTS